MGGLLGLDWPGSRVLLDTQGTALDAPLLDALRTLERAALAALRNAASNALHRPTTAQR